jgi:hypothetical protein
LDAEGTKLTNISFPANSILREIYVPNTLTSLTLTNQPYLTKIKFDSSAKGLMSIVLDNIPGLNTYPLVKEVYDSTAIKTFYLSNINWIIEDAQTAVEGNKLVGIDILDILANPAKAQPYYSSYNVAQSISGKITVNVAGLSVNEYEIYKKYKAIFPNVEIIFGEDMTTTHAYNIIFKTDNEADALIHYEVKAGVGANETIGLLTSADGPTGEAMRLPAKASTQAYDFKFTGHWIDQNGNKYYTNKAENPMGQELNTVIPSGDMIFYPEYITTDRYYQVKFYNYDNTVLKQPYTYTDESGATVTEMREAWNVKYGTVYDGPVKNFLYRSSNGLSEEERYGF